MAAPASKFEQPTLDVAFEVGGFPSRGSIVAVPLGKSDIALGIIGEKVAGGLFEVILAGGISGVFRLDELTVLHVLHRSRTRSPVEAPSSSLERSYSLASGELNEPTQ